MMHTISDCVLPDGALASRRHHIMLSQIRQFFIIHFDHLLLPTLFLQNRHYLILIYLYLYILINLKIILYSKINSFGVIIKAVLYLVVGLAIVFNALIGELSDGQVTGYYFADVCVGMAGFSVGLFNSITV